MIIGITGGTGCGKTTLLREIEARGGLVLDCDAVYHELLDRDDALLKAIDHRFPGTVVDKKLERKKLGAIVFNDEQALQDLNAITHAAVKQAVLQEMPPVPSLIAIDAIALFESGLAGLCDVTVAVTAPVEDRVKRLMNRDNISEDYARSRIAAQHTEDWFRQRCDHVLENSGDLSAFATKCVAFLDEVCII
jgi:dephospho-CoA kinase